MHPINGPLPCAAWSQHAAELAEPLVGELQEWPENPSVSAMVADGILHRLLPGVFVPPDVLGSALRRALLLGCAIGAGLRRHHVIAGPSAVWVMVGGSPPSPAELLTPAHRSPLAGVLMRHADLLARDIETVGGAPVTTPARTAADLLRFGTAQVASAGVRALLESGHVTERAIMRHVQALPHQYRTRAARERLTEIIEQTTVTFPALHKPGLRSRKIVPPGVREQVQRSRRIIRRSGQEPVSGVAAETGLPSAVTR